MGQDSGGQQLEKGLLPLGPPDCARWGHTARPLISPKLRRGPSAPPEGITSIALLSCSPSRPCDRSTATLPGAIQSAPLDHAQSRLIKVLCPVPFSTHPSFPPLVLHATRVPYPSLYTSSVRAAQTPGTRGARLPRRDPFASIPKPSQRNVRGGPRQHQSF